MSVINRFTQFLKRTYEENTIRVDVAASDSLSARFFQVATPAIMFATGMKARDQERLAKRIEAHMNKREAKMQSMEQMQTAFDKHAAPPKREGIVAESQAIHAADVMTGNDDSTFPQEQLMEIAKQQKEEVEQEIEIDHAKMRIAQAALKYRNSELHQLAQKMGDQNSYSNPLGDNFELMKAGLHLANGLLEGKSGEGTVNYWQKKIDEMPQSASKELNADIRQIMIHGAAISDIEKKIEEIKTTPIEKGFDMKEAPAIKAAMAAMPSEGGQMMSIIDKLNSPDGYSLANEGGNGHLKHVGLMLASAHLEGNRGSIGIWEKKLEKARAEAQSHYQKPDDALLNDIERIESLGEQMATLREKAAVDTPQKDSNASEKREALAQDMLIHGKQTQAVYENVESVKAEQEPAQEKKGGIASLFLKKVEDLGITGFLQSAFKAASKVTKDPEVRRTATEMAANVSTAVKESKHGKSLIDSASNVMTKLEDRAEKERQAASESMRQ